MHSNFLRSSTARMSGRLTVAFVLTPQPKQRLSWHRMALYEPLRCRFRTPKRRYGAQRTAYHCRSPHGSVVSSKTWHSVTPGRNLNPPLFADY